MATDKQIAANRENAKHSTGPKTERGKRRSSRNAFKHGLTAETIIDALENAADYDTLAKAINADYRPRTNFELQLVARLISLLWRLRRAISIESGLIDNQHKNLRMLNRNGTLEKNDNSGSFYISAPSLVPTLNQPKGETEVDNRSEKRSSKSNAARSFARIDGDVFERLGRYETRLWRQTFQIILLLNSVNRGSRDDFCDDERLFQLRSVMTKHRRALWPPFVTSVRP